MDPIQNFEPTLDTLTPETDTLTFETPASPVDAENDLVFFGDRNEGQTLPFANEL